MTAVIFSDAPLAAGLLTALEREVLDLVADGLTDPQIAERGGMTLAQAKAAVSRLSQFFDAPNRAGIVARGYRWGLLAGPDPVPDGRGVLTREQFDLLLLVAQGASNALIAETLGLTLDQVRFRITGLLRALDARGREHAVRRAIDLGALTLAPKGGAR